MTLQTRRIYDKYERGDHHCLEHVYQSVPGIYRCGVCIRETCSPQKAAQVFSEQLDAFDAWFRHERRHQILSIDKYASLAKWSSLCPQCACFINKNQSRIVELLHPHPNPYTKHYNDEGGSRDISGYYVHFECYKIMVRALPCTYCGETPAGTIDHRTPQLFNGEDEPYNLVASCASCNSSKGTRNKDNFTSYAENIRDES